MLGIKCACRRLNRFYLKMFFYIIIFIYIQGRVAIPAITNVTPGAEGKQWIYINIG